MKDKLKIDIGQLKGVKKGARATVFVMKYYVLIVIGYIGLYPLLYMLSNAFKGEKALVDVSLIWIPKYLSTKWFNEAFEIISFGDSLKRTFSLQILSAAIEVIVCAVIAYGFARFNFKGKKIATVFLVLSFMIPLPMYGMSLAVNYRSLDFLGIFGLIDRFTGVDLRLNIFNTNWSFWLPSLLGVGIRSGMMIYIYIQFFIGLPAELEDAAYVDGAGAIRTFVSIAIPSSSVVILTVSVLSFIWHWNETYLSALCLLDENWPLSVQMMNIKQKLVQAGMFLESTPRAGPIVFCACLLFIMIPLVLYLLIQRKFVASIDRVGITG